MIKCKECGETFSKTFQLEKHLDELEKMKEFKCEICNKGFHLNWRLQKHRNIHQDTPKTCKYFSKKEVCPFESIGCMFLHLDKAQDKETEIEDVIETDDEDDDSFFPVENQCHICKDMMPNKDDLFYHIQSQHEEYLSGVMEVVENQYHQE